MDYRKQELEMAQRIFAHFLPSPSPNTARDDTDEFYEHLLYFLKYRPVEPKSLELTLSAFKLIHNDEV